jgi:hypothetical protein
VKEGRAPRSRFVAHSWPLYLDDLGAEVTQHLRAGGSGENAAKIQHRDAIERTRHHGIEGYAPVVVKENKKSFRIS